MKHGCYTVGELIRRLQSLPQDAQVLLLMKIWDAQQACEDSYGVPDGMTVGCTAVIPHGDDHVYIVHSTEPDET